MNAEQTEVGSGKQIRKQSFCYFSNSHFPTYNLGLTDPDNQDGIESDGDIDGIPETDSPTVFTKNGIKTVT